MARKRPGGPSATILTLKGSRSSRLPASGTASAALDDEIRRAADGAAVIRLEPDFEAAARIASHDDKVLHAWQRFASAGADAVPPALASIVAATRELRP